MPPRDTPGPFDNTDDLAVRLIRAAGELHVHEIDDAGAYLGVAIAVSDLVRSLDEALSNGAPLPRRWASAGRPVDG